VDENSFSSQAIQRYLQEAPNVQERLFQDAAAGQTRSVNAIKTKLEGMMEILCPGESVSYISDDMMKELEEISKV
jgi:hypothetical protein